MNKALKYGISAVLFIAFFFIGIEIAARAFPGRAQRNTSFPLETKRDATSQSGTTLREADPRRNEPAGPTGNPEAPSAFNFNPDDASNAAVSTARAASTAYRVLNTDGMTVQTRFDAPQGYRRIPAEEDSFAAYLRRLPLKKDGEPVLYYDGREKSDDAYIAVVDQAISNKDLHQCADAVIRLRAQFLYEQGRYDDIAFHFVSGFLCDYASWRAGKRVKLNNGTPYWEQSAVPDSGEEKFQAYLETVYAYASTLSLEKELTAADVTDMRIGDVFIVGGSPGHAVIVVDMAENDTGKKCFMLAQSYMPAQQTQILRNLQDESISPWYPLDFGKSLVTPQWTFARDQLKRFPF